MEKYMEVPQNTKNRIIIWSSNSTSGYISKRNENWILKRHLHAHALWSITHNTQEAVATLNVHLQMNRYRKDNTYMQWNTIPPPKKEGNPVSYSVDQSWGHYAKWLKPVTKRQRLHDCTYVRHLQQSNSEKRKSRMVVVRGRWAAGGSKEELWVLVLCCTERCKWLTLPYCTLNNTGMAHS